MNKNKTKNFNLQDEEREATKSYKHQKHKIDEYEIIDEDEVDEDILFFCKKHIKNY